MTSEVVINKINKEINDGYFPKSVQAIILYGSCARGTNDENSDIDILVICEFESNKMTNKVEETIFKALQGYNVDVSIYESKKFQRLLECGSLYLHHIRDEGKMIYQRSPQYSKEYLFGKLRDFKGISEDLLLYERMMKKTAISLKENHANYFDINMLALLARNTMILMCYFMENPQYGKKEVFDACNNMFGDEFLFDEKIYDKLMKYRSYYNRKNIFITLPTDEECGGYISQVKQLIMLALEKMDIKNSIDRLYYLFKDNPGHNFYTSYEVFNDFDRDLYFVLNQYMKKQYDSEVNSITEPFVEELIKKHEDDDFVRCVYNVILDIKGVKKKSSNYSIDCPDLYTETDVLNAKTIGSYINDLVKTICKINFFNKLFGRFIKEEKDDIIKEMDCLREYIRDNLSDIKAGRQI